MPRALSSARNHAPVARRALFSLAAFVIVVAGLKLAAPVLVPLLVAMLLSAASAPIAAYLTSRGRSAGLAATIALLVDIAFVGGVGVVVVLCLDEVRTQAPTYYSRVIAIGDSASRWLERHHMQATAQAVGQMYDRDHMVSLLGSTVSTVADVVSNAVVLLLLVFFALCESAGIGEKLRRTLPNPIEKFARCETAVREVQRYLLVKTALGLAAATLIGAWLLAWRVDFPVLLALIAFFAHFVPNIGSVVAAVPAVGVALLEGGVGRAIAVGVGYLLINFSIGNFVEPRVLGRTMGLSPLFVVVAMLGWGWLWGPAGALLAVPLTMIARIAFENVEGLEWAAVWMGPALTHESAQPGSVEATGRASTPIGLGAPRFDDARPQAQQSLQALRRAGAHVLARRTSTPKGSTGR